MTGGDDRTKSVVIAAGGTGGHLFPAQALAEELGRRGYELTLITDKRGQEYAKSFPNASIVEVSAATFANRSIIGRLFAGLSIIVGIGEATWRLLRLRPDVVVGFGGYPSLPAVVGGILLRVPCCLHEQNSVLGRVNKRLAPFVTKIASTFPELRGLSPSHQSRVVVTGNPVRDTVRQRAASAYNAPGEGSPIKVLVFGGSQGASVFSEIVPKAISVLPEAMRVRLNVVQQCRDSEIEEVQKVYQSQNIVADIRSFFDDLPSKIEDAHLVLCRAGASSVTELAAIGRPGILVPLPSAMDDHQTYNAGFLADQGAGWLMPQPEFQVDRLSQLLRQLFQDPARLNVAAQKASSLGKPAATEALADLVDDLAMGQAAVARGAPA